MDHTLLIILIEVFLVALTALIVMLFLNWRNTTRCHAALERLFEDAKEQQSIRSDRIVACLMRQYQIDRPAAEELSATLFAAENMFLAQFIEQQMAEQSVDGFYQNLCELLDRYLTEIPARLTQSDEPCSTLKRSKPKDAGDASNGRREDGKKTPPPA